MPNAASGYIIKCPTHPLPPPPVFTKKLESFNLLLSIYKTPKGFIDAVVAAWTEFYNTWFSRLLWTFLFCFIEKQTKKCGGWGCGGYGWFKVCINLTRKFATKYLMHGRYYCDGFKLRVVSCFTMLQCLNYFNIKELVYYSHCSTDLIPPCQSNYMYTVHQ